MSSLLKVKVIVKNEGSDQEVYQPPPELQPSPVHGRLTTILDSMLVSTPK